MSSLREIAEKIHKDKEFITLIYAFNGTGKTRLGVEYKDFTKEIGNGEHLGVYYNAYSEDLFSWDNDEDNNNQGIKLDVKFSSLNSHYSSLTETKVRDELQYYYPTYDFDFINEADAATSITSISFYRKDAEDIAIKISRGEERIFIWCFFLALFKVEGWTDVQKEHIFIDDPVSSLDDNNVYITANTIMDLIDASYDQNKNFVITTHHIGFFSILYDRLKRGEKADRYSKNSTAYMLKVDKDDLSFNKFEKEIFLFHLHLLKTLDEARNTELFTYHFVLLRQLLENVSSFFGTSQIKILLQNIGVEDPDDAIMNLNSLSHKKVFVPQFKEMNENEGRIFNEILQKLIDKYDFNF